MNAEQKIIDMIRTGKSPQAAYNECMRELLTDVQLAAVMLERRRQDAKWGEQNHDPEKWISILGEEYGELCQAVNETIFDNGLEERKKGGYENIRREAIHVAAVAVGFLECLDRQVMREGKA